MVYKKDSLALELNIKKQAQRRAATETDTHIIIDILLHTVDAFIVDANIQSLI